MLALTPRQRGLAVLFCLLFGNSAHSAESLALEDAITATLSRNPDLLAQGYAMREQDARLLQARLAPRPELTVSVEDVLGTGVAQALSGAQTTVSIAWVLEGDLRQKRIDAASTGSQVLADEAQILRLDAAAATARLYLDALAHQHRIQLADAAIALAQDTIATLTQRVTIGTAAPHELARAQADLARRELTREDLEHELTGYYHQLAAQWGELNPAFAHVEGDPLQLPALENVAALQTRLAQTPDLQRFLSEQRLHESTLQLELAQRQSPWRVNAGLRRIESSSDFGLVAGVTIPLNRGNENQGRIEEARVRVQRSAAEQAAAQVRLQTALLLVHQEQTHAQHVVESLLTQVIPRYEDALQLVQQAYALGSTRYLDWLTVQDELLQAREELLEASILAHRNAIEIERLTGARATQGDAREEGSLAGKLPQSAVPTQTTPRGTP